MHSIVGWQYSRTREDITLNACVNLGTGSKAVGPHALAPTQPPIPVPTPLARPSTPSPQPKPNPQAPVSKPGSPAGSKSWADVVGGGSHPGAPLPSPKAQPPAPSRPGQHSSGTYGYCPLHVHREHSCSCFFLF
jgi:hypothetical protein